jgi:hypothetical protein
VADDARKPESVELSIADLMAAARARGITLSDADAAAIRPRIESLLTRLARLGEALPRDTAPQPTGGTRFPR